MSGKELQGKTILVTGATDGIGQETALELAQMGAAVIVHGRDAGRGAKTVDSIRRQTGNDQLTFEQADFASLHRVEALAGRIIAQYHRLDGLINNAGVYMTARELTQDGFEMTFGVNHLAHFLLTNRLLELLKASSPARIVVLSSQMHLSGRLDFDDLQMTRDFSGRAAYSNSKLLNVMHSNELAARLDPALVTVNSLHPGGVNTKMLATSTGRSGGGVSLAQGAETPIYLAASPEVAAVTGQYFERKKVVSHSPLADDPALRARLWDVSQKMIEAAL